MSKRTIRRILIGSILLISIVLIGLPAFARWRRGAQTQQEFLASLFTWETWDYPYITQLDIDDKNAGSASISITYGKHYELKHINWQTTNYGVSWSQTMTLGPGASVDNNLGILMADPWPPPDHLLYMGGFRSNVPILPELNHVITPFGSYIRSGPWLDWVTASVQDTSDRHTIWIAIHGHGIIIAANPRDPGPAPRPTRFWRIGEDGSLTEVKL